MSDRRRRYKEWEVIDVLLIQNVVIPCYRCGKPIKSGRDAQREHLHEIALDGKDDVLNCRYSHKDCHAVVTDGTKATSAGSSKHRIAKTKRLEKERANVNFLRKVVEAALGVPPPRPKAKIRSRGFQTNRAGPYRKPMRGGPAVRRNS